MEEVHQKQAILHDDVGLCTPMQFNRWNKHIPCRTSHYDQKDNFMDSCILTVYD